MNHPNTSRRSSYIDQVTVARGQPPTASTHMSGIDQSSTFAENARPRLNSDGSLRSDSSGATLMPTPSGSHVPNTAIFGSVADRASTFGPHHFPTADTASRHVRPVSSPGILMHSQTMSTLYSHDVIGIGEQLSHGQGPTLADVTYYVSVLQKVNTSQDKSVY
jgi:hypothetical protein